MRRNALRCLLAVLILAGLSFAQTRTSATQEGNNYFTGTNSFGDTFIRPSQTLGVGISDGSLGTFCTYTSFPWCYLRGAGVGALPTFQILTNGNGATDAGNFLVNGNAFFQTTKDGTVNYVHSSTTNNVNLTALEIQANNAQSGKTTIGIDVNSISCTGACSAVGIRSLGVQLATQAQPTCAAGYAGTLWYVAGGAGVKDSVSVCAKDASNAYAWRVIY